MINEWNSWKTHSRKLEIVFEETDSVQIKATNQVLLLLRTSWAQNTIMT